MKSIQLLDKNTINKIAAGEVVERPVSIVKELVENSIDAGATAVTIEIKDGGLKLIRITDNGSGIQPTDIDKAFLRHSTSKIRCADDLSHIMSLGFRGEALASISAVSMVEIITKTEDELTGMRCLYEDGTQKLGEEIGCPEGTTMIIKNLFYNVPARKKFLKSGSTEGSYISELVFRLALSRPEISFKYVINSKVKLHTSGNNNLKDCIMNVYNKEIAKNVLGINEKGEVYGIKGFIGKPTISRGNRNYETYYINKRYVKSKIIQKAIEDAYKDRITLHQYPFVVFDLSIDATKVDVNVHPTKMEVRFDDEKSIYDFIFQAIKTALNETELIREVSFLKPLKIKEKEEVKGAPEPFEVNRREATFNYRHENSTIDREEPTIKKDIVVKDKLGVYNQDRVDEKKEIVNTISVSQPEQLNFNKKLFLDEKERIHHKVVGQLFDTYWIIELKDKYYIIDQHAAHEKILYERIMNNLDDKVNYQQELLYPKVINLSPKEMNLYNEYASLFKKLGFLVEVFGDDAIVIRSIPFIFKRTINEHDFMSFLDGLDESMNPNQYDILLHDIATMACKAAIKGNDKMTKLEYEAMIDELLHLDNPFNCPHGRPTIIAMTKYELEKKFKRIM